ncbi:MAG: hypothetical protein WAN12_09050 [Candidatus Acidiferrum sp.]
MRRLCICVQIIVAVSLFCCAALSQTKAPKNDLDIILSHYPGQHLLTLKELDSDTRAFFLRRFPKGNPSVVHGDFDGDGHLDFAILLRDNKSGVTKLEVLLCSGVGQYKSVYTLDLGAHSGSVYIRPVPIGSKVSETDAIDTKDNLPPLKLRSTGIRLTYFEQAEVVLYWNRDHKKIEEVQTAD